jgi:ribose 5-phosphate isomerase A
MQHHSDGAIGKQMAGEEAVKYIENGMVIGIGTGTTSAYMIQALARRLREGLTIVGAVPTSEATAQLAGGLGIPLTDLDTHPELDLAIDGADEIDGQLRLIKGGGGALLREKIVASASRRFIIVADTTKLVTQLGHKFPVPVETITFARMPVALQLQALGAQVQLRQRDSQVFHTDSGNVILDCFFPGGIGNPESLHASIKAIVGVVETGLFLGMTERAIIGDASGIQVLISHS